MNKKINLIIGSGVLGAYLALELLKKKEKIIVTTRAIKKKMRNYDYLKIQKKIRFEKLDVNNKIAVKAIIEKYRPDKIFYFAGQSSLTKSIKDKKKTFSSHFNGSINFSKCNQGRKIKNKIF